MLIHTVAALSKSASIRREKDEKEVERTFVHLKFGGAFVQRDVVDFVLGVEGLSASLYDSQGAPVAPLILANATRKFTSAGVLKRGDGPDGASLTVRNADLERVELILCTNGAYLSGGLSWEVAGDEASDLEPLLGRDCGVKLTLETDRQIDMVDRIEREARAARGS